MEKQKRIRRKENPDIKNGFEDAKNAVKAVLNRSKFMELAGGKIYFVNEGDLAELLKIRATLEKHLETKSDIKRYGFGLIAKILNPEVPATAYYTGVKGKHRQINDPEKVKSNIEGEFAVWKNVTRKEAADYVALHNLNDDAISAIEKETERRITEAESRFEFIIRNWDELEVRIAGWEHEKLYPYISFTCKGKQVHKHVSIEVPTVLWYENVKYRSDMSVADFVKHSTNAFGDVYFMEK